MDDTKTKARKAMRVAGWFFGGSCALIFCSYLQEVLSGYNRYPLQGYIVPLIFGGIVGSLLGSKYLKAMMHNESLVVRIKELEVAVGGILPICSHCKAIREPGKNPKDKNSWSPVEDYLAQNTTSRFTHSICPNCVQEIYPEIYASRYQDSDSE